MKELVCWALAVYTLIVFLSVIFSWVRAFGRVNTDTTLYRFMRLMDDLVRPVLAPIRRVLPPLRLGGVGIDLSVLVLFLILIVVRTRLLRCTSSFLGF